MKKMVCELCGSNDFTKDKDGLFVCDYCRTKYTPEQAKSMLVEGTVRVDRSEDAERYLKLAKSALEHSNSSEAYDYANRALEIDTESSEAWFVKAQAAGWSSDISQPRYSEMVGAFEKAIFYAPEEEKEGLRRKAADELNNVAVGVHRISLNEVTEHPEWDEAWQEHISRTDDAITMFFRAHEWGAGRQPLDNIIDVSYGLFNGPKYENPDSSDQLKLIPSTTATRTLNDSGRKYFQAKVDEAVAKIREIDPEFTTSTPKPPSSSPCFVVTATMGDEGSLPVTVLRKFRSEVLSQSRVGQAFIAWYGEHGPGLASIISANPAVRVLTLLLVVIPATATAGLALWVGGHFASRHPGVSL